MRRRSTVSEPKSEDRVTPRVARRAAAEVAAASEAATAVPLIAGGDEDEDEPEPIVLSLRLDAGDTLIAKAAAGTPAAAPRPAALLPSDAPDTVVLSAAALDAVMQDHGVLRAPPLQELAATGASVPAAPAALTPDDAAEAIVLPAVAPRAPPSPVLKPGVLLHDYRIEGVLKDGAEVTRYQATDLTLNAPVTIREYLPLELVFRGSDGSVLPSATENLPRYREGLARYVAAARPLLALRHRAVARVARLIEDRNTAYLVLEQERGQSFAAWWPQQQKQLDEAALVALLLPLLDGLAALHRAGCAHGAIGADTLQLRASDGSFVLADPGGAVAEGDEARAAQQADIEALAALLYAATTGRTAPDSAARQADRDACQRAADAARGRHGQPFLRAIDAALQLDAAPRPRNVAEFRAMLCSDHAAAVQRFDATRQRRRPEPEAGAAAAAGHHAAVATAAAAAAGAHPATSAAAPAATAAAARPAATPGAIAGMGGGQPPSRADRLSPGSGGALADDTDRAAPSRPRALALLLPPNWPLALQFTLALVLVGVLPLLLVTALVLRGSVQSLVDAETNTLQLRATQAAATLSAQLADSRSRTAAWAADPAVAAWLAKPVEPAGAALRDQLLQQLQATPGLQAVSLLDSSGAVLLSTDAKSEGSSQSMRPWFAEAAAGRPYLGSLVAGLQAGSSSLTSAEPVRGDGGVVLGVLSVRQAGAAFTGTVQQLQDDARLTPFLVDADGVVLQHRHADLRHRSLMPLSAETAAAIRADQRFRQDTLASLNESALAQAVMGAKAPGHVAYRSAVSANAVVTAYAPVASLTSVAPAAGPGWVVAVSADSAALRAPLSQLGVQTLAAAALVLLLASALGWWLVQGWRRPLRAVTQGLALLGSNAAAAPPLTASRQDEVGQLVLAYNGLAERLRAGERGEDKLR